MKRVKLMLAMLSVSVLLACVGVFAACGGLLDRKEDETYYTVTIAPYDGEGGTVTVSASESDKGYVKDEEVTVTVTPAASYVVDEVKVNAVAVTLTDGKYTFKVAGDTVISVTFDYVGWQGTTWHEATLGTLTFDEDYNMTLTPPGGTAQPVTIVTEGVDLSEKLPAGEVKAIVVAGASVATYKISFGTFLVFKQGYTEYIFDSDPITDFSAYEGTWKQYNSTAELVVTATGATYGDETYSAYYTAFDGSHYVKDGTRRYLFGYLDNAKAVIYLNLGASVFHFTKDGTLPKATFPEEFFGEWWNETYYTLAITAAGATVNDSVEVNAFAVTGAGADAIVHVYYNNLYNTIYMQKNATTSEAEVVLDNGTIKSVFTAVKPEPLPTEYRGNWTELVGTKTLTVNTEGSLTYEGKVREATRDSHDFGFHFLTDAGKKATVMYFPKGAVLALDDGDGNISYYAKTSVDELNYITPSTFPDGTWKSGNKTLTVSAEKEVTLIEGTETAKPIRFVSWEYISDDAQPHYSAETVYEGVYCLLDYNTVTQVVTIDQYDNLAMRTAVTTTFTKDGVEVTKTIPAEFGGTWKEALDTFAGDVDEMNAITIDVSAGTIQHGTAPAITEWEVFGTSPENYQLTYDYAQVEHTLTLTMDMGGENLAIVDSTSDTTTIYVYSDVLASAKKISVTALQNKHWKTADGAIKLAIASDGTLEVKKVASFLVISIGTDGFTMCFRSGDDAWYKGEYDSAQSKFTLTGLDGVAKVMTEYTPVLPPEGMEGTWYNVDLSSSMGINPVTISEDGITLPQPIDATIDEFTADADNKTITFNTSIDMGEGAPSPASVTITLFDANVIEVKITASGTTIPSYYLNGNMFTYGTFQGGLMLGNATETWKTSGELGMITIDEGMLGFGEDYSKIAVVTSGNLTDGFAFVLFEDDGYTTTYYKATIDGVTMTVTSADNTKTYTYTKFEVDEAFIGTWNAYGESGTDHKLVVAGHKVTFGEENVTNSATVEALTLRFTGGGTDYTAALLPEIGDATGKLAMSLTSEEAPLYLVKSTAKSKTAEEDLTYTEWTQGDSTTLFIDSKGVVKIGDDTPFVISYGKEETTVKWTMLYNNSFYKAVVSDETITLYTSEHYAEETTADITFTRKKGTNVTFSADMRGEWVCKTFIPSQSVGGSSQEGSEYKLSVWANTLKWRDTVIASVTDASEGKYSFSTAAPIGGSGETTYTFLAKSGDVLLLDDGTQTYALFREEWVDDNLETTVEAPDEYTMGNWTGATGEKLLISLESDTDTGHEVFITVSGKGLDGNPIWLLEGATTTLARGYCKPDTTTHYVYAEMSLAEGTISLKLFFRFGEPETYTFTQKAAEETYETPFAMRDDWVLFTDGALDNNHTIEVKKNSIVFGGQAVTGVSVDDDVVTFTANGKTYTAKTVADDYALCLQAEGDDTYSIYVSSLLDESEKAYTTFTGTWTSEEGMGDLVFAADGSATLNAKAVFGVAGGHIGVTYFTFVADGMVYKATLSGSTITLTDLDDNSYTYTKQV